MNEQKSSIQENLERLTFSRNADIGQLITDWPRLQNVLYINGTSIGALLKNEGVVITEDTNTDDPNLHQKFKGLLSQLVPTNAESDDINNQLASVLHQGGLPFSLEREVVGVLTTNGKMLDSAKQAMHRRVDLISTDKGFEVRELFVYSGNISNQDPDNPVYEQQKGGVPLLTGKCEYEVTINKEGITPVFNSMTLSSSEDDLEKILLSNPAEKTQQMRESLAGMKREAMQDAQDDASKDLPDNHRPS